MIPWARLSLASGAVVAGGVGLGAALSAFVHPVPVEAPAPPWAGLPETRIAAPSPHDADRDYANYYPRDLTPSRDLQTAVALLDTDWPVEEEPVAIETPAVEPVPEPEPALIVPADLPPAAGQAKTIHILSAGDGAEQASSPPA